MDFQAELQALLSLHGLISLIILSLLELVLGVDNIIFISLLVIKLPEETRLKASITGMSLAFIMRVIILLCLVWLSNITATLFTVSGFQVSIRDVLFFIGGVYLAISTVNELIKHLRHKSELTSISNAGYKSIIFQIVLVDILFSFDSIFTAIGIMPNIFIMVIAIGIGIIFMIYFARKISKFIEKYPTVKTLALCFIIGVGAMLIAQAFHIEIPKRYFYAVLILILITIGMAAKLKKK